MKNPECACHRCGGDSRPVPDCSYLQCTECESFVFPEDSPAHVDGITPSDRVMNARCPVCECSLVAGHVDGQPALFCPQCFGILMANNTFGEVIRLRRADSEDQEYSPPPPLDPSELKRTIWCPSCRNRMEVHPYYGPGNAVVDSCSVCHLIWLDHSELTAIELAARTSRTSGSPGW